LHSCLRPVLWSGVAVAVTLASCEFRSTRKMLAATRKAICMPETVRDEYNVEVAGRVADTPIHDGLGQVNRHANLSEFWHSVYWIGPTLAASSEREG
jgi:hypothetical protein